LYWREARLAYAENRQRFFFAANYMQVWTFLREPISKFGCSWFPTMTEVGQLRKRETASSV